MGGTVGLRLVFVVVWLGFGGSFLAMSRGGSEFPQQGSNSSIQQCKLRALTTGPPKSPGLGLLEEHVQLKKRRDSGSRGTNSN